MALKITTLRRSLRAYQIYGANTNVGKTIMSTILCKASLQKYPNESVHYLKPVSTGPLDEADDHHLSRFSPETKARCLFQFNEAVSPHIAARTSEPLPDSQVYEKVLAHLTDCAQSGPSTLILETAGGVHSPTPSGSSQADLFRPLRLPVCLVADHRLGGISASISAFESLHIRGYDLDAVLQFEDHKYQNHAYLQSFFEKKGILSLSLPSPPSKRDIEQEDFEVMSDYYDRTSRLDVVGEAISQLSEKHTARVQALEEMSDKAHKQIWYPFTQHQDVSPQTILAIDSAYGDFFQVYSTPPATTTTTSQDLVLTPTFDGSASWWTQGLGHGDPSLSLAAAYAAGRYGHVMFAGTIHQPALQLASNLLTHLQNPRLQKVFFSDNGSTGMEVATKMALTASLQRYKWDVPKSDIGVLGLKGSYHGDTIGAMDCSEPSVYNEKVHWYTARGYWFDFPQVKLVNGQWIVEPPEGMEEEFGGQTEFSDLTDIYDIQARLESPTGQRYQKYIQDTIERLVKHEGMTFGALIMEPVILGAGGMLFVDPLFQHTLVQVIRSNPQMFTKSTIPPTSSPDAWSGLPVVFDEVFTGLYRLGRFSASSFLQVQPDISVHAKLLTGGLIPLCATVASESIYEAFLGSEKSEALLHGHSYTAHPIGCHVANTSLNAMLEMDAGSDWQEFKDGWRQEKAAVSENQKPVTDVWSMWSKSFVNRISKSHKVESVVTLGSVLAIKLQDENASYSSTAAAGLQKQLLEQPTDFNIHVRVLGNVLYIMASKTSKRDTLECIESILDRELL